MFMFHIKLGSFYFSGFRKRLHFSYNKGRLFPQQGFAMRVPFNQTPKTQLYFKAICQLLYHEQFHIISKINYSHQNTK